MKKRILSILLLCCMVLTMLPTTAFAAGELPDVKLSVPTTFDKTVDLTGQNKELKIKDSKTYLIKGSADPNWYFQYRIKIDGKGKNITPHIFLDGVRLQAPKDGPAIELYGGASACLYFIGGDSELIGAENFAALQKNKTDGYLRVLVQTGTKLTCEGGRYGAGIGGSKVGIKNFSQGHGMNLHFGSLATDIYGGEILATSGVYGAGIGGGANGGVGEQIYVYSGKLTVRSVSEGAGIGGGQGGPGRFIYIKGGTVNAGSESGGAGIGSGDQDGQNKSEDAHHIEISGGTVEAWSNYAGAGIGGGRNGSGRDISITGGNVKAQGYLGAGIGGGMNGDSGNILIKDTTLTALAFPLYQDYGYTELSASAVGRGSNRAYYMAVMQDQEFAMIIEENIKIGASDGKSVWLSATGWQWHRSQGPYEMDWGTTTELLIPNENGRVDLQRLSLPYAYNYGRVISKLELRCEESTCSHELGWTDRDGCHIWACVKCGARDPAAEMSKQNAKHIPGDWSKQKQLCTVCGYVMGTDTKAPVLEGLKNGESYTIEDDIDGNPGAYTFTVSDPAESGETSSGIKSVTINGVPQTGPIYRLPAPDGGNNDAGAEHTVVATDNAGNETTATVRTYRRHHVKVISPDGNGTASASPDKAVAGTEITLTATPKEDYRFKEWQVVSPAGLVITNNKFTMPDSNVEVKAIFEEDAPAPTAPAKPSIRVTGAYTYNGSEHTATVSGYDPTTMNITGNTATDAGDYTVRVTSKTGKWADGSTDAVTAAWSIGKATQEAPNGLIGVAPTTEGGSDGKISGVTDKMEYRMAGESIYTPCSGTEIENLSADHYFVRYAGDNNHFASSDAAVTVGEGTPLAECTITFNAGGGSGNMDSVTVKAGANYTLPACGFTEPEGKQFKGWSTSADGSVISGTTYEVSSDTTFYAIWESKEYSIIVTDGKATIGAGSEISKAAQGTTITLTANAAPDGKVFDKWVVESGSATLEDANSETTTFIMPDSEVSVKATYTIPHTHTYDQEIQKPETLKSAADCTNDAVYFKSCSCGEISTTETFTAAGTQLGHAWASDWSKDTDNHWKECSRCHEKKEEAAHDYGSDNICDTCGYDKTVPHTHNLTLVPAKAPTCTEKGNTAYYTCDGCDKWFEDATGASEITDKTSVILAATGHSVSDWKSDHTDHWKECTVVGCGVIIEDSKAAHTAGEWIIDTPATGGGEHTHSYGSDWKYDADNHWHECSCGDKADKAAHDFKWVVDKEATATQKGSKHEECKVCGYKKAAVEILATGSTTKPTDPTQTNSNTGAEGPKTGDNSNMILWIALLFISSGAVIGITVYSKKKKENAE